MIYSEPDLVPYLKDGMGLNWPKSPSTKLDELANINLTSDRLGTDIVLYQISFSENRNSEFILSYKYEVINTHIYKDMIFSEYSSTSWG